MDINKVSNIHSHLKLFSGFPEIGAWMPQNSLPDIIQMLRKILGHQGA